MVFCCTSMTLSSVPSGLALSSRDWPGIGSLPRKKAMRFPSGEKAMSLSMSRPIGRGSPPSTGAR
jgi:hypothetical protein